MAWLLTEAEFRRAADGVLRGEVTAELYAFVWRLVFATTAAGLLAPGLSPTGTWDDEARADVAHGFIERRLLRGGLQRAFDRCEDARTLARYLETALLNWLRSEARSRHRPRLVQRTRMVLEQDSTFHAFIGAKSWLDVWWGLAEWSEPQPYQGADEELTSRASSLGPFTPLRFTRGGARADPVLSTSELRRLIGELLQDSKRLLTIRHFDHVFRTLFAYAYVGELSLELASEPSAAEVHPFDDVAADETAREVLIVLTERQLSILLDRITHQHTLDQLAALYEVSRGTVDNELRRAMIAIRERIADDTDIELVLEKLVGMTLDKKWRSS